MSDFKSSLLIFPRGFASVGLLIISIFKLYAIMNSGVYFTSMLSLCITGFFPLDATNVFLLWMAAFALFLGVRTRVVALFSLLLVGVQVAICVSHLTHGMTMGQHAMQVVLFDLVLLSVLLTSLSICVLKGGGPLAMYARGWSWATLD
jgi:hypothetical protein